MSGYDVMIDATRCTFAEQRSLAEKAIAQVDEKQLFARPREDANSIASLMKHVGGNLRSRWSDFLTTDGEKPDRDRDAEFEPDSDSAAAIREAWIAGWETLETTLAALTMADLERTVTVRTEQLTVSLAMQRSLAHTAQHVGQIILLARILKGGEWATLSIARGGSRAFNEELRKRSEGQSPRPA